MTVATLSLADFLLARIAEDEAVVRFCLDDEAYKMNRTDRIAVGVGTSQREVEFADRFTPPFALALCHARRRIVELRRAECGETTSRREDPEMWAAVDAQTVSRGGEVRQHYPTGRPGWPCEGCEAARAADAQLDAVLRLLAQVYADHPHYRQEWRP